ncbi:hypothetical protein [Afipia sp. GAS231]|uniref:hypothetical protein n=1 Tax=Afipia sp. GAS231 TaxID=1882747 RepID=UPI0012FA7383|nr:hypothetical protein [Afipia sp. GAS231]
MLEGLLRLKALQYAETERCGPNAAARTGDAGQFFRRAWIAGVVRLNCFVCSPVMAVANGVKLRAEDGFEINGLCHRGLDTVREFVNCRRHCEFNRPWTVKKIELNGFADGWTAFSLWLSEKTMGERSHCAVAGQIHRIMRFAVPALTSCCGINTCTGRPSAAHSRRDAKIAKA